MRSAVDEMSSKLSHHVSTVLTHSFRQESKRRRLWLVVVVLAQLGLAWMLFRVANARAESYFRTTYYDPFSPTSFHHDSAFLSYISPSSHFHNSATGLFLPEYVPNMQTSIEKTRTWHFYIRCLYILWDSIVSLGLDSTGFPHGSFLGHTSILSSVDQVSASMPIVPT